MLELLKTLAPKGIGYAYYQLMEKSRQRTAQCDVTTGREQTYSELVQQCIGVALKMQQSGLKPGDFVAICALNAIDVCVPYFASLFVGTITAAVDPNMSVSEAVYLLNQVMPKMIFVEPEAISLIEKVAEELETKPMIVTFGEALSKFAMVSTEEFVPQEPSDLNETALVLFSSGSTGKPKAICHTHKSMLATNENSILDGYSTIGWFTNPYWVSFYTGTHMWIINGMCRMVLRSFDRNDPWLPFKFKIDYLLLNTTQAVALLTHPKPDEADASNILVLDMGGHSVSAKQMSAFLEVLPQTKVLNLYGQSEIFGYPFTLPLGIRQKYPDSIGTPIVTWKVVNFVTDEVLGPNQTGELLIKADFQCKGYHNCDSSDVFDSDGFLKTGDLVYYNDDMAFFIVNRIKESFKYSLYQILPSEIEQVLLTHPSINKAVVLGVPHEMNGSHAMAVVELKTNVSKVSAEDIVRYVEERVLDKNRLRAGVRIVEKIPLTVTDKVHRMKLREMVLNNDM